MNYTSIIDTSTPWLIALALKADDQGRLSLLANKSSYINREKDNWMHSSYKTLTESTVEAAAFDHMILGRGPGSFTGLRVSFAYLKTIAMLNDIPVSTVNSMQLWHTLLCEDRHSLLLVRTNRVLYYGGFYENNSFRTSAHTLEEWAAFCRDKNITRIDLWHEAWRESVRKASKRKKNQNQTWAETAPEAFFKEAMVMLTTPAEADLDRLTGSAFLKTLATQSTHWSAIEPDYGHSLSFERKL